jgi:hypothetical protein
MSSTDNNQARQWPPGTLSASFRLAIEIRQMNKEGTPATTPGLIERLAPLMSKAVTRVALITLEDYGIIEGHYGPTGDGGRGCCYTRSVTEDVAPFIDTLAEKLQQGVLVYVPEA